tara:strand:+ start:3185 stop:4126 length:942 start_codon:yes stop_codon:yes gene_type:complete
MKTILGNNIKKAIDHLNNGDIIAMPTETVYGFAANALNESAVKKIFELKKRPFSQAISIQISSLSEIKKLIKVMPVNAEALAENFWPGPLTMIFDKSDYISDLVTGGKSTVGIRIPQHEQSLSLLRKINYPLAVPSANIHNQISCTSAKEVFKKFKNKINYILDGGPSSKGIESTIVGFKKNQVIVFRLGAISINELEKVFKDKNIIIDQTKQNNKLGSTIPIFKFQDIKLLSEKSCKRIGVIHFDTELIDVIPKTNQVVLSHKSDINEASKKLYAAIHKLNLCDLDKIYIKPFPDVDIGKSINQLIERLTVK